VASAQSGLYIVLDFASAPQPKNAVYDFAVAIDKER
jgi:hypothetical protein